MWRVYMSHPGSLICMPMYFTEPIPIPTLPMLREVWHLMDLPSVPGVTTLVDAGSSGWRTFRKFKHQTIDAAQTRVLAFISIVGSGMYGRLEAQNVHRYGCHLDCFYD